MSVPRVLIVAGSDSGGGAGIQADIKTVTMLGGHATTAITAITAQNTRGVFDVMPVPAAMVTAQIDAVLDDIGADAIKIGMIGSAEVADAVADRIERLGDIPIVFDPVMVATSGATLADEATVAAFGRLMRLATVVTPNAPELAAITGRDVRFKIQLEPAAMAVAIEHGCAVLAKGGHLSAERLLDLLVRPDGTVVRWENDRIETQDTHGTGCTLASGIATGLAAGLSLEDAVTRARSFLRAALAAAPRLGQGHGPMGHGLIARPFDAADGDAPARLASPISAS